MRYLSELKRIQCTGRKTALSGLSGRLKHLRIRLVIRILKYRGRVKRPDDNLPAAFLLPFASPEAPSL